MPTKPCLSLSPLVNILRGQPFPEGAKHVANAHFKGVNSIVLANRDGLLTRLFVALPGMMDPALCDPFGQFLYHDHGYDFRETCWLGMVVNYNWTKCEQTTPGAQQFVRYEFVPGLASGQVPTVRNGHLDYIRPTGRDVCFPGEHFKLHYYQYHRVTFHPCPKTGWFAALVEELYQPSRLRANIVYSPSEISEIPHAAELYKPLSDDEARFILETLLLTGFRISLNTTHGE